MRTFEASFAPAPGSGAGVIGTGGGEGNCSPLEDEEWIHGEEHI